MQVNSTYYSRIHIAHINGKGEVFNEVDVDSRPSDAINLAVRFDAPMYITKQVANYATSYPVEPLSQQSETNAEIVRSVRETLASFEVSKISKHA
jgi:bifunctional DNase/RNase